MGPASGQAGPIQHRPVAAVSWHDRSVPAKLFSEKHSQINRCNVATNSGMRPVCTVSSQVSHEAVCNSTSLTRQRVAVERQDDQPCQILDA